MSNTLTFEELLRKARAELQGSELEEAATDARILLMHASGKSRAGLIAAGCGKVPQTVKAQYKNLIARRKTHEPVAYILGQKEFFSLVFTVDERVLIPRPETELLVEHALDALSRTKNPNILDVGTGSGAVLLSLLSARADGRGLGVDISEDALDIAQKNARFHNLEAQVQFMHSDFLTAVATAIKNGTQDKFDILVSNPPYIDGAAMAKLPRGISQYEPRAALYGGGDGLDAYRAIIGGMAEVLKPGGRAVFEIGFDQARPVEQMLENYGCKKIERFKDFAGHDRIVCGVS